MVNNVKLSIVEIFFNMNQMIKLNAYKQRGQNKCKKSEFTHLLSEKKKTFVNQCKSKWEFTIDFRMIY